MNPPYTLVVVDMQAHLDAANDETTIVANEQLIEQAKQDGALIVFLWTTYYSPTDDQPLPRPHKRLLDLVSGYPHAKVIDKLGSDGSCLVHHCCSQQGCSNQFVICGVHTDVCVLETALGLARSNTAATVTVHRAACNSSSKKDCWSDFGVEPNIVVRW